MEDETSAHYALQIAVTILRERCQLFQKRITVLEEENVSLRSLSQKNNSRQNSFTHVDSLKQQIAAIEEQNNQLQSKMKIISQENRQLWENLGKLTHMNKSLGSHLNKINNTLSEHASRHQPLIRSKTFTQDKPHLVDNQANIKKFENKLDLEDISLKFMNSMSEIRNEIDSLSQHVENVDIDNIITSSLGFNYDEEETDIVEDLKIILEELTYVKNESELQNTLLKENLENIKNLKANSKCDNCLKYNYQRDCETMNSNENHTDKLQQKDIETNISQDTMCDLEKICPICSHQFPEADPFSLFLSHVQSHFRIDELD